MLAGTNAEKILVAAVLMMEISRTWNNPFGNGDAAHRIIEVCKKKGTL
jgi:UDP-N-acetylglucosamine 2-epimerase